MKADPTFDLELYWRVLRRRIWLMMIPVVVLTAIVGLGSFLLPNIYLAQSQVVVRQEQDPIKGLAVQTQITQQLGGVIQALQRPSEQKQIFERLEATRPPGLTVEGALADFRDNLQVRARDEERDLIVDFTYTGTPEQYAIDVVNAFADQFQQNGTRLVASSLTVSLDFVEEQLAEYRKRLQKLDDDERRLQVQLTEELSDLGPIASGQGLSQFVANRLAKGESEADKLRLEIDAREAKASYLESQLAATPPTLALRSGEGAGRAQAELESLLGSARAKRVALLTIYTEQHPEVIALTEQIREIENRMEEVRAGDLGNRSDVANPQYENLQKELFGIDAELQYSRKRLEQIDARNKKLREVALRLPGVDKELRRLREERDALQTTHDSLLQRRESLELNQSFEEGRNTGRFEVRRAGGVPLRPVRPNRPKIAILGLLGGLFIGLSFVLLAEYLDHAVRSGEDLGRYVDAPLLAVLPRAPD